MSMDTSCIVCGHYRAPYVEREPVAPGRRALARYCQRCVNNIKGLPATKFEQVSARGGR